MKSPRNVLVFNIDGVTIEGHVIGASHIIYGDLRDRGIQQVDGQDKHLKADTGKLLFDRQTDGANRAWFLLDFEKGGRLKVRNEDNNE